MAAGHGGNVLGETRERRLQFCIYIFEWQRRLWRTNDVKRAVLPVTQCNVNLQQNVAQFRQRASLLRTSGIAILFICTLKDTCSTCKIFNNIGSCSEIDREWEREYVPGSHKQRQNEL